VFDLEAGKEVSSWQAESGWASSYEFSADEGTIRLGYPDGAKFAYTPDGRVASNLVGGWAVCHVGS
jgi:hypothetical protein